MFNRWLKHYTPSKKTLEKQVGFSWLKHYMHHPNLWHFNRDSVAKGVGIGLFVAILPVPFQMILACFIAVLFHGNLPTAVLMTWISNPITFVPINYLIFMIGNGLLGGGETNGHLPTVTLDFNNIGAFFASLSAWVSQFGKAYAVGLPILATVAAITGYALVIFAWICQDYFRKKK